MQYIRSFSIAAQSSYQLLTNFYNEVIKVEKKEMNGI